MGACKRYALVTTLLLSIFLLSACGSSGNPTASSGTTTSSSGTTSVSNDQRIYNTSTSDSGEPITYTGGPGMMMPLELACANCHGPEGRGGTVQFMMQTFDVPNITWPVLTGPDPNKERPPYTEETLKQAITQSVDPGGSPLDYPMPRWQMSPQDLNDLVALIKTLK